MRRWIAALCVAAGLALLVGLRPTEVLAHTEFESSDPADGAAVAEPVTDVIVTFTGPATPVGEGFEVLDPQGTVREPDDVVAGQVEGTDDATFTLRFEPPLAGGSVGVRWSVEAADGHSISGSFSSR